MKKLYLAGPIDNIPVKEATAWRRELTARLRPLGIKTIDQIPEAVSKR